MLAHLKSIFWAYLLHSSFGSRQIRPWQIGPLENVGAANWAPGKLAPKMHKRSYTIKLIHKYSIIVGRIYPLQIYKLENILKLNSFCYYWICSAKNLGIHIGRCRCCATCSFSLKYVYSRIYIF